ncbi:MAG: YbhB/YbcL family Raf kinase inhibitor-like protein [Ruminiclostridium sp.]|nr:YbhB/YbcL family Raf kinase inhibitor-like protein [Ruminiclostridium sp.]
MLIALLILVLLALILTGFVFYSKKSLKDVIHPEENLTVTSTAFAEGSMIPVQYTGKAENINPPLDLGNLSPQSKTIAIVMDDIDFPVGIYNHWIIWNIPVAYTSIPEGIPHDQVIVSLGNAIQGKSQYGGKHYYRGPLPPFGVHRYVFKVYVLDTVLELDQNAGKIELQKAMDGHILQYGTLMGKFGQERK